MRGEERRGEERRKDAEETDLMPVREQSKGTIRDSIHTMALGIMVDGKVVTSGAWWCLFCRGTKQRETNHAGERAKRRESDSRACTGAGHIKGGRTK